MRRQEQTGLFFSLAAVCSSCDKISRAARFVRAEHLRLRSRQCDTAHSTRVNEMRHDNERMAALFAANRFTCGAGEQMRAALSSRLDGRR